MSLLGPLRVLVHRGGPEIVRTCDTLTVLGAGSGLLRDVERCGVIGDVAAVNGTIARWPGSIDHAVTCHPGPWLLAAMARRLEGGERVLSHTSVLASRRATDHGWGFEPVPTDSSMLAAYIGLAVGYERIRLLGVPMDDSGYWWDGAPQESGHSLLLHQWVKRQHILAGRVRAASGNLVPYLGELEG